MRLLILSKRHYTGKDLLDDRYGRIFELPAWLSRFGHAVTGLALSYRPSPEGEYRWDDLPGLCWHSVNARGLWRYLQPLNKILGDTRPEAIWACSDAFHGIFAQQLGRHLGIPVVVDLYDNFESFGASRLPGVVPLLRRACRGADGITVVGRELDAYIGQRYGPTRRRLVLNNGVDTTVFRPYDCREARRLMQLPTDAPLIGTAGALTAGRGIAALFDAFLRLAAEDPAIHLVVAGPRDATLDGYRHPRIIDLGEMPQARVPMLLSSLDIAVVCNRDSAFGCYCFPQKLYECAACGVPVVAAAIGETARILEAHPHLLYTPADGADLSRRLRAVLDDPLKQRPVIRPVHWQELAAALGQYLEAVVGTASGGSPASPIPPPGMGLAGGPPSAPR